MAGRNSIDIDLARVERLAAQGLTDEQVATSLGVSQSTITRRKRTSDQFAEALNRGKVRGIEEVTNTLWLNATEKQNTSAAIFYLKNRAGWSEKAAVSAEHIGQVSVEHGIEDALAVLQRYGIDPGEL